MFGIWEHNLRNWVREDDLEWFAIANVADLFAHFEDDQGSGTRVEKTVYLDIDLPHRARDECLSLAAIVSKTMGKLFIAERIDSIPL